MKKISSLVKILILLLLSGAIVIGGKYAINLIPDNSSSDSNEFADIYEKAKNIEEIKIDELDKTINKVYKVSDDSSQIGYIFDATVPKGYAGPINFLIGISNDGIIQGFRPVENSETEGFGKKMEEPAFIDGMKGVNVSKSFSFGEGNKDEGQIVAISGATITTSAISEQIKVVINQLSKLSDKVNSVVEKVPYFVDKYEELFKHDLNNYTFEEFEKEDFYNDSLKRIVRVKIKNSDVVDSYILNLNAKGYGGNIKYLLRLSPEYLVHKFLVAEHSETEGFGAYIENDAYKNAFVGLNLDKNLITKSVKLKLDPKGEKDIYMISGATVTSSGMKTSLDKVIESLVSFNKVKDNNDLYKKIDLEEILKESQPKGYDHASLIEGFESGETIKTGVSEEVLAITKAVIKGEESYIFDVNVKGFTPLIEYAVITNLEGEIKSIVFYSVKETPDYGGVITEQKYIDSIVGKKLKEIEKFVAGENIDAISGATLTTNGMVNGMNAVLEAFKGLE